MNRIPDNALVDYSIPNVLRDGTELPPLTVENLKEYITDDATYKELMEADDETKKLVFDIINRYCLSISNEKNFNTEEVPDVLWKCAQNKFGRGDTMHKDIEIRDIIDTLVSRHALKDAGVKDDFDDEGNTELVSKNDMKPVLANASYDMATGVHNVDLAATTVNTPPLTQEEAEAKIDELFAAMTGTDSQRIDLDTMINVMGDDFVKNAIGKDVNLEETLQFVSVIDKYMNGELKNGLFEALPPTFRKEIIRQLPGGRMCSKRMLEGAAKAFLDGISKDFCQNSMNSLDLNKTISEINKVQEEMLNGTKQMEGSLNVMKFNNTLDIFIKRRDKLLEEGKEVNANAVEEVFIKPLIQTIELTDFKEFCKTVRIKRYELERPDKVFKDFNMKYFDNRRNIYNIAGCIDVLSKQLKDREEPAKDGAKICIAFCKYCRNMVPENDAEHTFMYYFIMNILTLNLIYPNGVVVDSEVSTDESRDFYNKMLASLTECAVNLERKE